MRKKPVVALVCLALCWSAPLFAGEAAKGERLAAEARVGKDPLIVMLARLDSLMSPVDSMMDLVSRVDEGITPEKIEEAFAKIDAEIGFSLREDLLEQLGPEFGLVVDLGPIDTVMEKAGGFPGTAPEMLGGIGLFAQVRNREKVDLSLRKLFLSIDEGIEIVHDDETLAHVRFPMKAPMSGVDTHLEVVYGIRDGWVALGVSADWVRATLDGPSAGERLADGADYRRVMSHLDADPDLILYANLPEVLTQVEGSNMVKMMLGANVEAQRMMDAFANEEYLGVGWGHTSIEIDGGSRASSYGPRAFSGPAMYAGVVAAIAIPNFLNAVDRGKQKRTMADVRSIGTAIEAYSIDNDRYPVTDGWQTVDALAEALEPVYIRTLPREDGWGRPIRVHSDGETYTIASPGKDGEPDQEWVGEVKTGPTTSFNADVVFSDGQFIRWPEGTQQ